MPCRWLGRCRRQDRRLGREAYTAIDTNGRTYGTATGGGNINLAGATGFVIIRPGAELNADGVAITVNSAAGMSPALSGNALTVASNGGSIALSSSSGLYLDGNMHAAAGGPGSVGGNLSISLSTAIFSRPEHFRAGQCACSQHCMTVAPGRSNHCCPPTSRRGPMRRA